MFLFSSITPDRPRALLIAETTKLTSPRITNHCPVSVRQREPWFRLGSLWVIGPLRWRPEAQLDTDIIHKSKLTKSGSVSELACVSEYKSIATL